MTERAAQRAALEEDGLADGRREAGGVGTGERVEVVVADALGMPFPTRRVRVGDDNAELGLRSGLDSPSAADTEQVGDAQAFPFLLPDLVGHRVAFQDDRLMAELIAQVGGDGRRAGRAHGEKAGEVGVLLEPHSGVPEQVGGGNAQGGGEVEDVVESDVAMAAFDAADIGPVEARPLGELLLGEAAGQSKRTDARPEGGTSGAVGAVTGPGHDRGTLGTV
jgi:hypothetical protein